MSYNKGLKTRVGEIEEKINTLNKLTGKKYYLRFLMDSVYTVKEEVRPIDEVGEFGIRWNIDNNPTLLYATSEQEIIDMLIDYITPLK